MPTTTLSEPELLPEDVELERLLALKLAPPTEAHSNIHRMYNSIMFDDEHPFPFASMQIQHHIEEYWSKTYGQGKDDTLFMAAYRAGLYTADSTANEIFLHAMRYIGQVGAIHFQSEHLNSLQLLADFNQHETEIVVCAADWILAADVITKEQYAQVVRMIFVERLDLDPSAFNDTINNFIGDLEYYEHKHFVAVNKQMEVYSTIRHSHLSSEYSETRALAVALARAGAEAPLEQVEETTNNDPIAIAVSPLCIDHYEGGEFGEKNWTQYTDVKKEEDVTLEVMIMTSCYEMEMMMKNDGGSQLFGARNRSSANMDVGSELNDGTGAFRNEEEGDGGIIDEESRGEMRTTSGGGMKEKESNTCIASSDKYEDDEAITMNDHPILNETSASAPNIGGTDCEAEVNKVDFTVAVEEVKPSNHASSHVWNNGGGGISDANDRVSVSSLYEGTISGDEHADGVHTSLRNSTVKADWLMYDIFHVGENAKIRPDTNKYEDGEGLDDLCLDGCIDSSNRREAHLSLVSSSRHFPPKGKARALKESLAFEKGSLLPNAVRSIQAGILTIVMFVKYLAGLISMATFVKNGCHSSFAGTRMVASIKPVNQVRNENHRPSKIPAAFASNGGVVAGKHSTYQIAESDVRENCALGSNDYFWLWQLIGLAGTVFLAIVTVLTRIAEAKTVSVQDINNNQEKKRIKTFTGVHRGRKNHNFLLRVVFCFLLTSTAQATSQSEFEYVSTKKNLDYDDFCDVSGTMELSCVCLTGNEWIMNKGRHTYFICEKHCNTFFRQEGYCAQCAAGKFWGNYYDEGESKYQLSNAACPSNDDDTCTCGTTTHSPDSGSTLKYYFEYVCNHNANDNAMPMNQVMFNDELERSNKGKCSTCPPGTYSVQGDKVCKPCQKGRYSSSEGSSQCTQCPSGKYSDDTGFTSCKVCDAGTYSYRGSTQCITCSAGYYSSSSGSSGCDFCPAGSYTDSDSKATLCTKASTGHYVGETNENSLPYLKEYECPIGSYSSTTGQSHCTSCPPNTSTHDPGSTSLLDCISCPYGVDANTFACIETPSTQLNNVCWDASQLLSLGASSAVADLQDRVYSLPDVGMNALISDAMNVIEEAAKGISSIEDIQTVLDKLKNAPERWLGGLSDNFDSCVASTSDGIINVANSDTSLYHNTNLFQYQFGDIFAHNRAEWIAQWRCKGATFGCLSFDTTGCPQAQTCFAPLYKYFGPFLSYAGGTVFGNYQQLITGRYTPRYSPSFISDLLEGNVKSLVQWENAAASFQRYYNVMDEIEQGIEDIKEFTADAINAVLQVQTVSTSVSLESSYTEGNLYYEQALYNYNETFDIAQIIQYGPAFCPSGYEITADGIPNGCTDYATLVKECQTEILWNAAMKLISDTMKLAAGLVQPMPGGASAEAIAAFKGFNAIANLATLSTTLLQQPWSAGSLWDPNTEMPTLPVSSADGSFADEQYADASYQWYLDGQKDLSDSLIVWSPARWDAIYLENEKQYGPTVLNPPNCPNHKSKIVAALNDYLLNVESMSNYGSSMTAALMSLVPAMGNIAAGIATQAAIANAGKEISGMVKTSNANLGETAPPEYQNVSEQLFFTPYEDISKAILAYAPSASLAQQQYVAAKSIFGFCTSYSYMNAGQDYENTFDGKTANCKEFGSLYLPTYETFNGTVNSFVYGTLSSIDNAPVLVNNLNKNIEDFAANVKKNPEAVGQTQQEVGNNVKTFTLDFAYDPNSTSTTSYYGNLTDGKIRFTLTPSSSVLLESISPFAVDTNARVINVQTFWRGVTSAFPSAIVYLKTTINPIGPYMVYPDPSGEGTTFNLPPYLDDGVFFAQFRSIQHQNECVTGVKAVDTVWRNGEHLQFCTPYASDLEQPFAGIADYAFNFPSMWTTWEVEADHDEWNSEYFNINETELALQVMFRYVASPNPSQEGGPSKCAMKCEVGLSTRDNVPLLGEEWCDRKACNDCVASHSYNGTQLTTDPFCRCNVWDGTHETCTPSTAITDSFTVAFSNSNRRRRLKKKKAKNGIESDSETVKAGKSGAEAKSGKSEMMSEMALGLRELLQTYLEDCDGNAADGIGGNALVQIGECKKKGKKRHNCDFHLTVPAYEGEAESIKNEANACIVAMLGEDAVKEAIAEFLSSCDVVVYRTVDSKNMMIKKWNLCSLLE